MKEQTDKTRLKLLKRLQKALNASPSANVAAGPCPASSSRACSVATPNLIPLLEEEITKTGGVFYLARDKEEIAQYLITLAKRVNAKTIIRDNSILLQGLKLDGVLNNEGLQVIIDYSGTRPAKETKEDKAAWHQQAKDAALGVTSIEYILADTGTVVIKSRPGLSRTLSLVPPIHVAIGEERQILPGLETLFSQGANLQPGSAVIFITGPSRTADIEQTLTIGVHGPIEFHFILLPDE